MATQILNGENLPARKATTDEQIQLRRLLKAKEEVKKQMEIINEILGELPQNEAIVSDVHQTLEDGSSVETVTKTFVVGEPKGHYVTYKEVDLVMNAKTTKKLLKEMGEE